MKLTHDEMWEAVIQNDRGYDGRFFYAVKTTGVVCRPSCKSKNPKKENVSYFFQLSHAIEEGFRSCKRCQPDLIDPQDEADVIKHAVEIIKKEYMTDLTLKILAYKVGMSPFHFQRLFKKEKGLTPTSYMAEYRLNKSIDLLKETDWTITKIAHEVGYQTAPYFSYCFRKKWSFAPSTYRRLHKIETMEDSR